jgi:hypothetical protein
MTSLSEDHHVLKSDTRGRVRVPVERREALLDEFERSGLSGLKFAAFAGVKYPTFALWVQKRRKARQSQTDDTAETPGTSAPGPEPARPLRLFEAVAELERVPNCAAGLILELPGGTKARIDSPGQVRLAAELLRLIALPGGRSC